MKCLICNNMTTKKIKCLLCNEVFCSYNCMESHIILAHNNKIIQNIIDIKKNLNNNINNNIQTEKENKEERETKIKSPYLIPGILNIRRTYDEKYNLDNFIPIFENGKPKIIGCGSFGKVFLVMNKINKKYYAIKHMEKQILINKMNNLDGIYKEIYIQSRIDHPNIVPILYVNETVSDFDLVLEYAVYGSLFYFIRNNKSLNEPLSFSLFMQVVNAVYFLHKNNLIHRDIKPENILIFDNNILKLCDFGWCVKLEQGEQRDTFCGTTEYMSPELVNHMEYSKEIDVWSLGILLYEMIHGHSPFRPDKPKFNSDDVMDNIRKHKLKFKKNVSKECKELIYHLLEENPEKRLKVEDIFYSDFVKYYENMKFGLPDYYLIEKYKFKLTKFQNQNNIQLNEKNKEKNNLNNNNHINISNYFESESDNNKRKKIYSHKKIKNKSELFPLSLSDKNIIGKKRKKNKTTLFFNSIINVNNINYFYSGRAKSKSNSRSVLKSQENFPAKKIKTIIIPNYFKELNERNNLKIVQKEKSNNNKYINIEENNEEQNNNDKNINSNNIKKISYKKKFRLKQLKMNKIPINTKIYNNAHSPTNALDLNSIVNKNNLVLKKNITPKNKLSIKTDNNKNNSINKSNNKINNKGQIIEVKKNKYSFSPKLILKMNNNIKKVNTRNNLKSRYDNKIKNNSEENITNTKANTNSNTNNSIANTYLNNKDDINEQKYKINKLYYTKSLTQLKRKVEKNIKSMFFTNILNQNNINNYTLSSENKKNNIKEDNLNNIKRIYTSMVSSPKISNISTYNHILGLRINNSKCTKKYYYLNDILSPNISYSFKKNNSYTSHTHNFNNKNHFQNISKNNLIYKKSQNSQKIFSRKKLLKSNSPEELKHIKDFSKNQKNLSNISEKELFIKNVNTNYYYDKLKIPLNLSSYNSIFKKNINPKKIYKIKKNNTNLNNIKNNSKIIALKKSEIINKQPNKRNLEKNRYNSNSNINASIKPKIFSLDNENIKNDNSSTTRLILNNKTNNKVNEQNINYKYKILKKFDVNKFLNNIKSSKDKNKIFSLNIDYNNNTNCNTSYHKNHHKINTSLNDKNYIEYFQKNRNKLKCDSYIENSLRLKINKDNNTNKNSFCSRNYNNEKTNNNIKSTKNKINKNNKTLNLDGKNIILRKDKKIIISPITQKFKKDIKIPKGNVIKTENINYINCKNDIYNNEQSRYIYKKKIEEYGKGNKFKGNIIIKNN